MSVPRKRMWPTPEELRHAGVELRITRIAAELEKLLSTTRRGRLALRLARWYARRKP